MLLSSAIEPGRSLPLFTVVIAALCTLLGAGACAARHEPAAEEPPDLRGTSSYTVQAEPISARVKLTEQQELLAPQPLPTNVAPAYPPPPLAARFGAATVGVRIIIGPDGRVLKISDSPIVTSTTGPYSPDFRAAVEEAVRGWTFQAAVFRRLEDGPDNDGDGRPDWKKVVASDEIAVYIDVRFDFDMVEGRGVVTSASGPRTDP